MISIIFICFFIYTASFLYRAPLHVVATLTISSFCFSSFVFLFINLYTINVYFYFVLMLLHILYFVYVSIFEKTTVDTSSFLRQHRYVYIFALLVVAMSIINYRASFWDEFEWSNLAKIIYFNRSYWNWESPITHTVNLMSYPPGIPILQNFFLIVSSFNEPALAFSNLFFSIILFLTCFHILTSYIDYWPLQHCLVASFIVTMIGKVFGSHILDNSYLHIYVDSVLGTIFLMVLIIICFEKNKFYKNLLLFCLFPYFFIIKITGYPLALICISVVLAYDHRKPLLNFKNVHLLFTSLLLFCVPGIFMRYLWGVYVDQNILKPSGESIVTVSLKTLILALSDYKRVFITIQALYKAIFTTSIVPISGQFLPFNFYTIDVVFLYLVFIYIAHKKYLFINYKILDSARVIYWGFILWILAHLYIWLCVFNYYEGTKLASFSRYIGTYASGLVGFLFFSLLASRRILGSNDLKQHKMLYLCGRIKLFVISVAMMLFSILIILTFINIPLNDGVAKSNTIKKLNYVKFLALNILKVIPENKKIWFIAIDSIGEEKVMFRYLVSPRNDASKPHLYYSFKLKCTREQNSSNEFCQELNPDQVVDIALRYGIDYVFIYYADNSFIETYGGVFGIDKFPAPLLLDVSGWKNNKGLTPLLVSY